MAVIFQHTINSLVFITAGTFFYELETKYFVINKIHSYFKVCNLFKSFFGKLLALEYE